jgi:hypothetical protein
MPEPATPKSMNRRLIWILLLVNLSIPGFVLLERNGNDLNDAVFILTGWISAIWMTTLFAFQFRRHLPGQKVPRQTIIAAVGMVVLSGLITTITVFAYPSNNFLELAQSGIALDRIKPERKRLVVELIRRDAASSVEYQKAGAATKPISPALYSVDSFASKAIMESTSSQLQHAFDTDEAYAESKREAMKDFHDKMLNVDPDYLHSFESNINEVDVMDSAIEATEQKWMKCTLDLYAYGIAHADQISVNKNGHLVIANQKFRQSFLQQLDACRTLDDAMDKQREKEVNDRNMILDGLGIKHTD